MADNLTTQSATPATVPASSVIATDDVSSVHFQKVKLDGGADGVSTPIIAGQQTAANSLPVTLTALEEGLIGALTETAPATDTASSGLNGRLQRIAQRITSLIAAIGSPFQAGGSIGNTTFASTQSGTWTVQPGNTANTTAWKVDGSAVTQPVSGTVAVTGVATAANQSTANTALSAIQTAVETIDNFISGSKGLVTEDNSASIKTAVETIDNFISGSRGLVTEDSAAAIKTAVEIIDNFISGSRGLVTEDNSAAALTALQLIDDVIATLGTATYTEATTKGAVIGAVRRDADTTLVDTTNEIAPLQVDARGALKVEAFSGETLPVSLASVPSHAVTNAGTFPVQVDGTALTRLTDIETNTDSSAVVGNGAAATAQRVTLANDSTGIVALTTSSAAIGKLAANSGVDIGDVTLTAGADAIGKLLPPDIDITTHTVYAKKYYTNAGAVTDGIVWSPASGTRWHVVSMYINTSAAAVITLEDDKAGGDEAVWKGEFAANSGMTIHFGEMYPLASGEDAADLIVTTSAGNVYITITGYEK